MRIAIAADHNGFTVKARLIDWLTARAHEVDDRGTHGTETVDYPALCETICRQVVAGRADWAIMIGGTGSGEQIACNKVRGIRAGVCNDVFLAEIARANNDANVLVMGAKVVTAELAEEIAGVWLTTAFKGGQHQRRIDQIAALERGETLPPLE